jgi:nucleotide-binding universal stress UspA family protein
MRILIAANKSSDALEALHLGCQIARRADEPPTLLTVIGPRVECHPPHAANTPSSVGASLDPELLNVRTKVRVGYPVKEIIREAQEGRYDLLIISGPQGRHRLAHSLLGSTALRVAKHAPCSVLVEKGNGRPIRHILLCDSGAESPSIGLSRAARHPALIQFTAQLVDLLEQDVEITVLHVMSQISARPGLPGRQLRAGAEELIAESSPEGELLKQDIRSLARPGIHLQPRVRHGLVVDEILTESRDGDYDLVIIGARHDYGPRHILLEDLAQRIVSRSDRAVLVVR